MNIDKSKSAIILIEFQKQWTEKSFYNLLINQQLVSRNVLSNTHILVNKARKKGIKIIHAPLIIDPKNKKGLLAYITFGQVFTKDTWKSEFTEGFFIEDDIIVKGRYAFDAFIGSNLLEILEENDIENLFFCGFTTDDCVALTMKTAIKEGYNCYLVSDCTATKNNFFQKRTEHFFNNKVINHKEILDNL